MKTRVIVLILFILIFCINIFGRAKVDGYATKTRNVKTTATINYNLGETYPNCTITVYLAGTTTLATIYSNDSGSIKSNPFTSDSNAYYSFYIDDGRYDIRFSGTGITSPFTRGDVIVYDYARNLAKQSTIGRSKTDVDPIDLTNPIVVGKNSPLVINRKKVYNIDSYSGVADNSTDNKVMIDNALTAISNAGGGVLEFNGNGVYKTSGGHVLPSNITIEGAFAGENGVARIQLISTTPNNYIFKIGGNKRNLNFNNVELYLPSNGIGILVQGTYPDSTFNINLDNVLIYGGSVGFDVDQLTGASDWEANNINITKARFLYQTTAGVRCDTVNTLFNIVSSLFYIPANKDGFLGIKVGQLNITSSLGLSAVGTLPTCILGVSNTAQPRTFIRLEGEHGTVTINNSPSEGFQEHLRVDYNSYQWPVTMIGTQAQAKVILDGDVKFVSIGNGYFRQGVELSEDARVTSIGDTVFTTTDYCLNSESNMSPFNISGGAIVTGYIGGDLGSGITNVFKLITWFTDDDIASSVLTDPLVYFKSSNTGKYLMKLGNDSAYYYVEKGSDGFLHFGTNQSAPFKGYKLDGVIDLLGQSTANNSSSGRAVIYFDSDDNLAKVSRNGGAYEIILSTATGFITNRVLKAGSASIPVSSNISDDGSNVHVLVGSFFVDSGNITISSGNLNLTLGNINIANGNLSQTLGTSNLNIVNVNNGLSVNGGSIIDNPIVTFSDGDTTPDISTSNYFITANTTATSITNFDNGVSKKTIVVFCGDSNTTIVDGGTLKIAGNLVCTSDDVIALYFNGTNWIQLYRSVN